MPGRSKNGIAPAAGSMATYCRIPRNRHAVSSREENANGRPPAAPPASGRPRPCFRDREPDHRSLEGGLPGDGGLAGYTMSRIQEGEFGSPDAVAVLDVIGIDPDLQGKGVGKALLGEMERRLKARGIGTLRTLVDWGTPAMGRFFSSAGVHPAPV